jgi:hypothetical protein
MAIAGVDTQGSSQLSALRNTQQPSRAEENRAQESQDARFGTTDTSQTEAREERFGDAASPLPGQGSSVPSTSLASGSLSALIQATQEQDTGPTQTGAGQTESTQTGTTPIGTAPTGSTQTESTQTGTAQAASAEDERQEEAAAPNSTNSLLPGASDRNGTGATGGVSVFV